MKTPIDFSDLELNADFQLNVFPKLDLSNRPVPVIVDYSKIKDQLKSKLQPNFSVVGIDIYRYSEYDQLEQVLLPKLFDELYQATNEMIQYNFIYIFQNYIIHGEERTNRIKDYFIGTGDGGYQIFENPLQSLLYICVFESILRMYNSNHFMPKLFELIGPLTLRYAITTNSLYHFQSSFYGPAIITNARILSKDKLNRLLLDDNTFCWFQLNCLGIENIMNMHLENLYDKEDFLDYNRIFATVEENELIYLNDEAARREGIKNVDVQKLGVLKSKKTEIDVYNVYLQVHVKLIHTFFRETLEFTYSIGNQNPQGLVED